MDWKLVNIVKETSHPFLNFYTLTYEVDKGSGKKEYRYFMASRHDVKNLLVNSGNTSRPDGVILLLYKKDKEGNVSILMNKQFRPAIGRYVTSVPAGLMDQEDSSIEETARREAKEESGAILKEVELLVAPGPTSEGLSDELDCVILSEIDHFESNRLEEYEDIDSGLVPLKRVKEMMNDPQYLFSLPLHCLLLYVFSRFEK